MPPSASHILMITFVSTVLLLDGGHAFYTKPLHHQPAVPMTATTPWGVAKTSIAPLQDHVVYERRKSARRQSTPTTFISCRPDSSSSSSSVLLLGATPSDDDRTSDELSSRPRPGPLKLIIAGAPASGKGTQCEVIKSKYGVVHLSTGDMLRAAVSEGTEVGKVAKEYMDAGKLVPDDVIIGVVKDRLAKEDCQTRGWLLDGFPRTEKQAQALADAGICADCFLFLNVDDEILVERVVGRRTDPETGKIYHMTFSPPPDDVPVDRLVHRSDDTEEKVIVRLEQFHANVRAVKDSYADISVTVDGNQNPSAVSDAIFDAVESQIRVSV